MSVLLKNGGRFPLRTRYGFISLQGSLARKCHFSNPQKHVPEEPIVSAKGAGGGLFATVLAASGGFALGYAMCSILSNQLPKEDENLPQHHLKAEIAEMGRATTVKDVARKFGDTNYVYRVALTGGPCGGKSTSLKAFSKELAARGYDVYRAPEVPTILMNGGCKYPGIDGGEKLFDFEKHLMDLQLQTERSFTGVAASTGRPSVVVMDRGMLDIAAYLPQDKWEELLKRNNLTEEYLLGRYDMVLHLVSAADGAEKFYTKANNSARSETPEQARALDKKMIDCWANHPHHSVIDNSTDFKGKLDRATAAIVAMVEGGSP